MCVFFFHPSEWNLDFLGGGLFGGRNGKFLLFINDDFWKCFDTVRVKIKIVIKHKRKKGPNINVN